MTKPWHSRLGVTGADGDVSTSKMCYLLGVIVFLVLAINEAAHTNRLPDAIHTVALLTAVCFPKLWGQFLNRSSFVASETVTRTEHEALPEGVRAPTEHDNG